MIYVWETKENIQYNILDYILYKLFIGNQLFNEYIELIVVVVFFIMEYILKFIQQ